MDDIQGGIKHEIIRIDYVAAFDRGIDQYLMSVISESWLFISNCVRSLSSHREIVVYKNIWYHSVIK